MTILSNETLVVCLEFHYDAGHGWLRVKLKDIKTLGIADKISSCSYFKGEWAYLEEDCDADVFLKAYKEYAKAHNIGEVNVRFDEISDGDDSPIRQYRCFDREAIDWEKM